MMSLSDILLPHQVRSLKWLAPFSVVAELSTVVGLLITNFYAVVSLVHKLGNGDKYDSRTDVFICALFYFDFVKLQFYIFASRHPNSTPLLASYSILLNVSTDLYYASSLTHLAIVMISQRSGR